MSEPAKTYVKERNCGRREEDRQLLDQIFRQRNVFQNCKVITSEMNLENLFDVISLAEETDDDDKQPHASVLERMLKRLHSIYGTDAFCSEKIDLPMFMHGICDEAIDVMGAREIAIFQ
jgi:hypothetical protein